MAEVQPLDEFIVSVARETWDTFRREPVLFVIASVVGMVVSVLSLGLLIGPMYVGLLEMARKVRAGEPVAVSTLFSRMDSLVSSSVALLIMGLAATLGMVLLILPGVLVIVFTHWSLLGITYARMSGVDSLRHSIGLVRTYPMHTLSAIFVVWVLHALGSLVVLGVLFTLPLGTIATALAYERLTLATPAVPRYAAG